MKLVRSAVSVVVVLSASFALAQNEARKSFDQLKALEGMWEGTNSQGQSIRVSFRSTAGGSALMSEIHGHGPENMITMFHMDGDRLLLTHYCMAGNQPRMQARAYNPESGEQEFQFLDATNLTTPGAGHMHNVKFRFVDQDHLAAQWEFYENGQPKMTETAQYTRVR